MELWDAYDAHLNIIGDQTLVRGEKIPKGVYHLVSEIIVRHQEGMYLLTQRDERKNFGGMWEATAGGSALQGENPLECVKRELREEIGILTDDFIEVGCVLHQKYQTYYVNYLCYTDVDKDSIVWYYFDENGRVVTGDQEINVQELHFDENCVRTKGGFATDAEGHKHSYDAKTGDLEDENVALVEA